MDTAINIGNFWETAGDTALHFAARFGNADVAEFLIASAADTGAVDAKGRQPAHWAAYRHQIEALRVLQRSGAGARLYLAG